MHATPSRSPIDTHQAASITPHHPHFMHTGQEMPVSLPLAVSPLYSHPFGASSSVIALPVSYSFREGPAPSELQYILPPDIRVPNIVNEGDMYRIVSDTVQHYPSPVSAQNTSPVGGQNSSSLDYSDDQSPSENRSTPSTDASVRPHTYEDTNRPSNVTYPHAYGPTLYMVPSTSADTMMSFDGDSGTFPKRVKASNPSQADPYAAAYLRDQLGDEKWEIFSSRLFERRFSGQNPRTKNKSQGNIANENEAKSGGAGAVEFLIKVEVVKEILRSYVPHPYNPLKSLSHPYEPSPAGQVTLTRSTVLALSGWSNTQFSYWARRSEAVSVLSEHDSRLRAVASALDRRLRGDGAGSSSLTEDFDAAADEAVTGKGLDAIIEAVKKRTGASQFLRGKHSSLDPFGSLAQDVELDENGVQRPQAVYMPTFQAQMYRHSPPPLHTVPANEHQPPALHSPRDCSPPLYIMSTACAPNPGTEQHGADTPIPTLQAHNFAASPAGRPRRVTAGRKQGNGAEESAHRELFPVSDSRSEVRARPPKRRADVAVVSGDGPKKRTRQSRT